MHGTAPVRCQDVLSEFVVLDRKFVVGQAVIVGGDKCVVLGPSHTDDTIEVFGPEIGIVAVHIYNVTPGNEPSHT